MFQPAACTLELRGLCDVTPDLAASDSRALGDFLVELGAVTGTSENAVGAAPLVTTLDAVEVVRSTMTGVVIHLEPLGATVSTGDRLAKLYDPFEPDPKKSWQDVVAITGGVIFARWHQRMIQAGMVVVKIASPGGASSNGGARLLD